MRLNYYALFLSIIKKYTPEQAFQALDKGKPKCRIDPNQAATMKEMKDSGMTYSAIGRLYGIRADVVYRRIYPRRKTA